MNYNLYVGKMAEKGLISELDVYDIEQSPCANEYTRFFNFCIENIEIEKKQFGFNEVYI